MVLIINNREELIDSSVKLPNNFSDKFNEETEKSNVWLHLGGGNLYRGLHAEIAQKLLEQGELKKGVVVVEMFDKGIISDAYRPFNNQFIQVILHKNGELTKNYNCATAKSYFFGTPDENGWQETIKHFCNPNLQMVTMTITEKAYAVRNINGQILPDVQTDIEHGPVVPRSTMGKLAYLLWQRFQANQAPLAVVSTDNFAQNGEKLLQSILTIVKGWEKAGYIADDFIKYLTDKNCVSFPWTMIDRITPNPAESVAEILKSQNVPNVKLISTEQGTKIGTFANTEEINYLVVEDTFPNGRPSLEKADVLMTNRNTVELVDRMKVTTCLNPVHTSLAIFGCLLGYDSISKMMTNNNLNLLAKKIGIDEGLPVVVDPKIINPRQFVEEVINSRLPNPYIPDTPQRIATDTSQKIAIRFGETIKSYVASETLEVTDLEYIPLVLAAWCRYLQGTDDSGDSFTISPDPLGAELSERMNNMMQLSSTNQVKEFNELLSESAIFGVDLVKIGLASKIQSYFWQMQGEGAIKELLEKMLNGGN